MNGPAEHAGLSLAGARRVDHYALTVPELDIAVVFFEQLFGARTVYRELIEPAASAEIALQLDVPEGTRGRVAMLRLDAVTNLELFEYTGPGALKLPPPIGSSGFTCLAVTVRSLPDVLGRLEAWCRAAGIDELCLGAGLSAWWACSAGPALKLVERGPGGAHDSRAPELQAAAGWTRVDPGQVLRDRWPEDAGSGPSVRPLGRVDGFVLVTEDAGAAAAFICRTLGAEQEEAPAGVATPGWDGEGRAVCVRLGPTDRVEVWEAGPPPRSRRTQSNHDVGGHHVAIAVESIDIAAGDLGQRAGVRAVGRPYTNPSGPIAGARWEYFATEIGLYIELVEISPGPFPYEAQATACRAGAGHVTWADRPVLSWPGY